MPSVRNELYRDCGSFYNQLNEGYLLVAIASGSANQAQLNSLAMASPLGHD
ncbi:hypothetical protein [Trichocoleus sp. FACHB-262]|uniref:hypothetical protein n=1 Tax=Trichocoleus sp. FACHB-262 TaxID=2692869 RepID=UPI0016864A91|nr:hypothetical protein [Trichocoleus sp. FACHB-262]MBD2124320.1 hypothetical protein [Trichocoleus sp. FACHB-262]